MAACYPASEHQAGFTVADLTYASDNSAASGLDEQDTDIHRQICATALSCWLCVERYPAAFGIPDENDVDDTQYGVLPLLKVSTHRNLSRWVMIVSQLSVCKCHRQR